MSTKYTFKYMIMLSEAKLLYVDFFCDENGLLPFNFGYIAKIENITLHTYSLMIFSVGLHIETE